MLIFSGWSQHKNDFEVFGKAIQLAKYCVCRLMQIPAVLSEIFNIFSLTLMFKEEEVVHSNKLNLFIVSKKISLK